MSKNISKSVKIYISLPKETYKILNNNIQNLNYRNLKEYIKKKIILELLDNIKDSISVSNYSDNKNETLLNDLMTKTLYVRLDEKTYNHLYILSQKTGLAMSDIVRNIIKNHFESKIVNSE